MEWLEVVIGQGQPEAEVVQAFLEVVTRMDFTPRQSLGRAPSDTTSPAIPCVVPVQSALHGSIFQGLGGIDGGAWPAGVLDYAEVGEESETAAA